MSLFWVLRHYFMRYNICARAHKHIHGLSFSKRNIYLAFLSFTFNKLRHCHYSNFKIQPPSRWAQRFICLQLPAIWNDQCFTSTRRAWSKFNQTSKRLPAPVETRSRIAIRGFRTNFRFYIAFYLTLSLSLPCHLPPYSFCRLFTQHPALRILLELHSQFPRPSSR